MKHEELRHQLDSLVHCSTALDQSSVKVATTCLYPGFDQVQVFVSRNGDGYRVDDGGGAYWSGWEHGRDESQIRKCLARDAVRFRLKVEATKLVAEAISEDWLPSAILSVANASSSAAARIVEHLVAASEADLISRMFTALTRVYTVDRVKTEIEVSGKSGKAHKFNFAVGSFQEKVLLFDAVSPHHSSVAHKYTAFSDVKSAHVASAVGFVVFDRPLDSEDVSLMQQVAEVVPIASVSAASQRMLQ
jgi:hypothetical protein